MKLAGQRQWEISILLDQTKNFPSPWFSIPAVGILSYDFYLSNQSAVVKNSQSFKAYLIKINFVSFLVSLRINQFNKFIHSFQNQILGH